jgi:hypothetical protein
MGWEGLEEDAGAQLCLDSKTPVESAFPLETEEDYDRLHTRIAGGILLAIGLVVSYRILISGH